MMVVGTEEEEEKAITVVDWLQLPEDLTSHVMNKLFSISDYASFGAVCVKWRSVFENQHCCPRFKFPRQLPLLIIPTPPPPSPPHKKMIENGKKKKMLKMKMKKNGHWNHATTTIKSCSFYRITDGKIYNRLRLTMPVDRYYRGSSHGWLITVDNDGLIFPAQLMNPFFTTNNEIKLPPLTAHPFSKGKDPVHEYDHLRKAVLSAVPAVSNPKDLTVMAVFGNHTTLAFCKPGDEAWTSIKDGITGFQDVIYYKDKFYALHYKGSVRVCDVEKQTATTVVGPPVTEFKSYKKYLVESLGECFQVHRHVTDSHHYSTTRFKVFKLLSSLDPTERRMMRSEKPADWVEVNDLCDQVFFLGDNVAMSIPASHFPGCKPNCIYYTDDYNEGYCDSNCGPHDMGVYNLANGSFEQHYPTKFNSQIWPPPIWIEPTLARISSIHVPNTILFKERRSIM